ncbi:nuclear factor 7, brain-like [Halichoeres trimaculatus]|uniref:nuclear factor 7, brain-like n=1 Tax=Halichoeres trimaculatus TaxID=147232 RepID=UPI003D9F2845
MVHLEKSTQTWKQAASHNKTEASFTEMQIKKQFESLHQFLREEEADRLLLLRESEERKRSEADKQTDRVNQAIKSLEEKIQLIEEELDADGDGAKFLEGYKDTMNREPQQICRPLIDVTQHLGNLQYAVWEKMKHVTPYTPVTFDPRTAGWSLKVSPGLNSVCISPGPSQGLDLTLDVSVPDNPKRFHPYSCILGREGFDSGVHCWEVEVVDISNWTVGVAAQSVSRRTEFEACPEAGLWCISLRDGQYLALTTPPQDLDLDDTVLDLKSICVTLDWDEGTLDFKDADTNTHLFTFRHCFTEKVYPYFESISLFGGFAVLPQKVDISIGSDFVSAEDYGEDQVMNGELSSEEKDHSASTLYSNSTMPECGSLTEDKNTAICPAREESKTKPKRNNVKGKQVKIKSTGQEKVKVNKPSVKNQSSKPRFSVTYHVSLNKVLNFVKKLSGNHEALSVDHNNP